LIIVILKNEEEIKNLSEPLRNEFLNQRKRIKIEKVLSGWFFSVIISHNKILNLFFDDELLICYPKGFNIENYLSYKPSEMLFRLFQELGTEELDKFRLQINELEKRVFDRMSYAKFDEDLLKQLYEFKKVIDELARYYFLQEDLMEETEDEFKRVTFQVRRIRTAFEKLSNSTNTLIEIYLEMIDTITNDVMKFLTIVATIFIPLSFLASVYGMNFVYIPEIKWKYGYFSFWLFSLIFTIILIIFFKRKRWI
jgi:Mg2+ and Co2+ transporter CorA